MDFPGVKITMAVYNYVKSGISKGQHAPTVSLAEIDTQREQGFLAKLHIGGIVFRGCGIFVRVVQGHQEFTAAGVDIQDFQFRLQVLADHLAVVPRQGFFYAAAVNMGEIPAVDLGNLFFRLPRLRHPF
jgi:hypothetical protein